MKERIPKIDYSDRQKFVYQHDVYYGDIFRREYPERVLEIERKMLSKGDVLDDDDLEAIRAELI